MFFDAPSPLHEGSTVQCCRHVELTGQVRQKVVFFMRCSDVVTLMQKKKKGASNRDFEAWLTSNVGQEPFSKGGMPLKSHLRQRFELFTPQQPVDAQAPWFMTLEAAVFVIVRRGAMGPLLRAVAKAKGNKAFPKETTADKMLVSLWRAKLDVLSVPDVPGIEFSTPTVAFTRGVAASAPAPVRSRVADAVGEVGDPASAPPVMLRQVVEQRPEVPPAEEATTPIAVRRRPRSKAGDELLILADAAALTPKRVALDEAALPVSGSGSCDSLSESSSFAVRPPSVDDAPDSPAAAPVLVPPPLAEVARSGPAVEALVSAIKSAQDAQIASVRDPYEDVPKALSASSLVAFHIQHYPGIDTLKLRCTRAGHSVEPAPGGHGTRGPWRILLHAEGKNADTLRAFDRLSVVEMGIEYTKIESRASITLRGPIDSAPTVAQLLTTPLSLALPDELDNANARAQISQKAHLYPFALRHDPKTSRVQAMTPLAEDSIFLSVSLLGTLMREQLPQCGCGKRLRRDSIVCKFTEPFRELIIVGTCHRVGCGLKSVLFADRMRSEQRANHRRRGFVTLITQATPRPAMLLHHLLGGGSASPPRLNGPNGTRLYFSDACFEPAVKFMEGHFHEQMEFLAKFLCADVDVPVEVQISEDDEAGEAAAAPEGAVGPQMRSAKICGDGQHSRQTRKVLKNAPFTYVTFCSLSTGAVLLVVLLERKKLEKADLERREAARRLFPADKKEREAHVSAMPGYGYQFRGKVYRTHYRQAESAGLEIGLKILADYLGGDARINVAYDKLAAAPNLVTSIFISGKKLDDPWHVHKGFLPEMDALARSYPELSGLKECLEHPLRTLFKDKSTSSKQRAESILGWKFSDARELGAKATAALNELLKKIAKNFESVKPGFETSLVESFFSTHSAYWAKGMRYSLPTMYVHVACQVLQWNRVGDWPLKLWEVCKSALFKLECIDEQDEDEYTV